MSFIIIILRKEIHFDVVHKSIVFVFLSYIIYIFLSRFGGESFSFTRMSWIKTNFLWMMYRCGWATKPKQERVLAVRITREAFDRILSMAYTPKAQAAAGLGKEDIEVRLQWDPDHAPDGDKVDRRAIQMGLKGEVSSWIVRSQSPHPFYFLFFQIRSSFSLAVNELFSNG